MSETTSTSVTITNRSNVGVKWNLAVVDRQEIAKNIYFYLGADETAVDSMHGTLKSTPVNCSLNDLPSITIPIKVNGNLGGATLDDGRSLWSFQVTYEPNYNDKNAAMVVIPVSNAED